MAPDQNGIALVRTSAGQILVAWDGDRAEATLFDDDGRAIGDRWIDAGSPQEVVNGLRGLAASLSEPEAQQAARDAIRLAGASAQAPSPSGRANARTIGYGIVLVLLIGAAVVGIFTILGWLF
jgi:hypothetical protein